MDNSRAYRLLRLHQHSAGNDQFAGTHLSWPTPLVVECFARKTCRHTAVIPPATAASFSAVDITIIIVLIVVREFHSAVEVQAEFTVTVEIAFILKRISGVSAVSSHIQSIFADLVSDLERRVLVTDLVPSSTSHRS